MPLFELPDIVDEHRKIIHVDMDAFYASVEERNHPAFQQKALVIAPDPRKHNGHGVITTANYRARQYGVGSAMPAIRALELIPAEQLQFIDPNFTLYRQVSQQIHQIFATVTDLWEPVALDEAYLDVTHNHLAVTNPAQLAMIIQRTIHRGLQLTCSVGISYNKFLAKMASDYAKPFGRTIVNGDQARNFLAEMPLSKFQGIGAATQKKLAAMNLTTGADLQAVPIDVLTQKLGKMGYIIYQRARGIDDRLVKAQRQSKSIGNERSFNRPIFSDEQVEQQLLKMTNQVAKTLKTKNLHGQTVVLKVRTLDFVTYTRRKTLTQFTNDPQIILPVVQELFTELALNQQPLRLLGVTMTNLVSQAFQEINLFEEDNDEYFR
ncbi:DNA polymerase IV [Bombilactobacillus thymidiniphilus]|uniref:DNA polymerase IV n=1 Tax=Bombilactobacillus thymidiniphilus TaxID=2923363 RepID=A0ABY4PEG4_9LACO|nr:DNA polymerase IV [Bombilactobacillus thymidiniphilus]UQS83901.1 DNA polymerase IV [Bombilactobacillus thymidiniphilus]